jgi:hypothetical protein
MLDGHNIGYTINKFEISFVLHLATICTGFFCTYTNFVLIAYGNDLFYLMLRCEPQSAVVRERSKCSIPT